MRPGELMPSTTGRYADIGLASRRARLAHRWRRFRESVRVLLARPYRLAPQDTRVGYTMYREWGHWTVRPVTGWRARRWITPPIHATRAVPRDDRDTACDWAAELLGIPH
jgi:hypothetical protein